MLQVVVSSLEDHLPLDFCCVGLYDAVDRMLTVACVGERGQALGQRSSTSASRLACAWTSTACRSACAACSSTNRTSRGRPPALPSACRAAASGRSSARRSSSRASVFGVLIAARRVPTGFSSADCEFLRQLSEHVALAAHQAQLHTALQRAYDDLHQTQQAVMQQERLKALGQMASGIAHDINNAISPVALYTESLLETETGLSPRARDYLETIQRANEDVAATVARMREFYRPREAELVLSPVESERRGAGRHRAHARPLERHAAGARRRHRARHLARRQRPGGAGRRSRTARGAHQPGLQRGGRDARGRNAERPHAPHVGPVTRTRRPTASTSKCRTAASAWTPRRSAAAWSRSSPPRASAAPGSASPRSTAACSATTPRSTS